MKGSKIFCFNSLNSHEISLLKVQEEVLPRVFVSKYGLSQGLRENFLKKSQALINKFYLCSEARLECHRYIDLRFLKIRKYIRTQKNDSSN